MAKHVLLVFSDPADGKEAEYNDWYDNIHLGEVIAIDGFVGAQRFKVSDVVPSVTSHKYLAIYELDIDDPAIAMKNLTEATPTMRMSDAFNAATAQICMAGVVSPYLKAS